MLAGLTHRLRANQTRILASRFRASVAIILRGGQHEGSPVEVLFIKRSAREGDPWSGHVAFPGGKREGGESDMECAVRETREEVGIDLSAGFTFLGRLDDRPVYTGGMAVQGSAFCVGVWLQTVPSTLPMRLQQDEVADVRWVAVEHLMPHRVDWAGIARPAVRYLPGWLCTALGLHEIYLPSILLPAERDRPSKVEWRLWGMSLTATSDLLLAAGLCQKPLNRPPIDVRGNIAGRLLLNAYCGFLEVSEVVRGKGLGSLSARHAGTLAAALCLLSLGARQAALLFV